MEYCELCKIKEQKFRVVKETEHALVCVNIEPFVEGHCMIIPKAHRKAYAELRKEEARDMFALIEEMACVLRGAYGVDAALTMINHGATQTQEHIHVHMIPNKKEQGARSVMTAFFKRPFRIRAEERELERMKEHIQKYLR